MAKPIRKYGSRAISLAVFEKTAGDGSTKQFYSLQRSRKEGNEWKNESILLFKEQLKDVQKVLGQALAEEEGSSSPSFDLMSEENAVQIIEVLDWGVVEEAHSDGAVKLAHDYMVHADEAEVVVGIGDIDEAVETVRRELLSKGYTHFKVNRIQMKPDSSRKTAEFGAPPSNFALMCRYAQRSK